MKRGIQDMKSKRKRATAVSQPNLERQHTIEQTAMDGAWVMDLHGRLLEVNEAYCRMSGYTAQELTAMRICDLEESGTNGETAAHIRKAVEEGEDRFESRHRRKDRTIFEVEISLRYRTIGDGQLAVTLRDIADRMRDAERKKTERVFLETVLNNMMDSVSVVDARDYSILYANRQFLHFSGQIKDTTIGKHCYELNHYRSTPCSPPDENCPLAETLKTKQQSAVEHIHNGRNDEKRHFAITTIPILDESGEVERVIHIARDITQRKKTEQILRQQREELSQVGRLATVGEFAASIAHEIHQPLTAIMNNAMAAQRFLSLGSVTDIAEVCDALRDIIDDDRRAAAVVGHLRSFLKKKGAPQATSDVNTVIQEVLTILHGELVDKNVRVIQALNPDIPRVDCGHVELQQVLLNLIMNACDSLTHAEPQRRQIVIRTALGGPGSIVVAIQDSGKGLNANEIERCFESFYTTKPDGLGVGLSIIKSIVSAHGGRIWAENNPEGGATFSFTLSAHQGDIT